MKKIFLPEILQPHIILPKDTAHHVLNVLRHPLDKPFVIGDAAGKAGVYALELGNNQEVAARLMYLLPEAEERIPVVLLQSFLKGDKFEWILQKSTELNARGIMGFSSVNSVVKYSMDKLDAKEKRWRKILLEAAQQCGRKQIPFYQTIRDWEEVTKIYENPLLLVACENEKDYTLKEILTKCIFNEMGEKKEKSENSVLEAHDAAMIVIGPEGGLALKEVEELMSYGFVRVSLGETVLRAETAAIAALSMIQYEINM